jgi:uncharacterized repeat protein (TIGR03803 family)
LSILDFSITAGAWGPGSSPVMSYNFDQGLNISGNPVVNFNLNKDLGIVSGSISGNLGVNYNVAVGLHGALTLDAGGVNVDYYLNTNTTTSGAQSSNPTSNYAPSINTAGWTVVAQTINTGGLDLADSSLSLNLGYNVSADISGNIALSASALGFSTENYSNQFNQPLAGQANIPRITLTGAELEQIADDAVTAVAALINNNPALSEEDGGISVNYDDSSQLITVSADFGSLSIGLPQGVSTQAAAGPGSSLSTLSTTGQSPTFFSGTINIQPIVAAAFRLPGELVSGDFSIASNPNLGESLTYTTNIESLTANLGYSQSYSFLPNLPTVTMVDNLGQTITGPLGNNFQFAAPLGTGNLSVNATYTVSGVLQTYVNLYVTELFGYDLYSLFANAYFNDGGLNLNGTIGPYSLAYGQVPLATQTIPIISSQASYTSAPITQVYSIAYSNLPVLTESSFGLNSIETDLLTVSVSVAGVPNDAITGVEIYDYNQNRSLDLGAATENADGTWSFAAYDLVDGVHNFSAVATDSLGNTATSAPIAADIVATQGPTVTGTESVSGLTTKTSDTITINAAAENVPGDAIAGVEIYDGSADLGAATLSNGVWSFKATDLANGLHQFAAVATDVVGNSSTVTLATDIVATTPPTVAAAGSIAGLTDQTTDVITVTEANAVAGDPFTSVAIWNGYTYLGQATGSNGTWTYTASNLSPGEYQFRVVATDSVGYVSQASLPQVIVSSANITFNALGQFQTLRAAAGYGLVEDANGNLFGTTYYGGAYGQGTVYEIPKTASGYGSIVTFHDFTGSSDGGLPEAPLIADANGDLFGTTTGGGAYGDGTVFEITKSGSYYGQETVLASFNGQNGNNPQSSLYLDASGNLLGTTYGGDSGTAGGSVFELQKTAYGWGPITTVDAFSGAGGNNNGLDGDNPESGLIADSAGDLFGTTNVGGANGVGTVYEIPKTASGYGSIELLATFDSGNNAANPVAGLVADASGDLFGTTQNGGAYGLGTVYEIAKTAQGYGNLSVLVSFGGYANNQGSYPYSGLLVDAAGNLFGTTLQGGIAAGAAGNGGTLFEVPKTASGYGPVKVLYTYSNGYGVRPLSLIADANGDLFGTTANGGVSNDGVIFEFTGLGYVVGPPAISGAASGQSTANGAPLQAFSGVTITDNTAGATDTLTITQTGADGTLTGTGLTATGTAGVYTLSGTAAWITGELEALTFTPASNGIGTSATTGFTLADTSSTGLKANNVSTSVTNVTQAVFATLAALSGANGSAPSGPLLFDANGNILVTTWAGGANGQGAVTEIPATASGYGPATVLAAIDTVTAMPAPTITGVTWNSQTETVVISGSGFGSQAAYSGESGYLRFYDSTDGVAAGYVGGGEADGIGLNVTSWSNSQIEIQGFTGVYGGSLVFNPGDTMQISVEDASNPAVSPITSAASALTYSLTVPSTPTVPTITGVTWNSQTQTVVISGSGFGSQAAYSGESGYLRFYDSTDGVAAGYVGGNESDAIGLDVTSWSDTQIEIQGFTGAYGGS